MHLRRLFQIFSELHVVTCSQMAFVVVELSKWRRLIAYVTHGHFCKGPPNTKGINYFDLLFFAIIIHSPNLTGSKIDNLNCITDLVLPSFFFLFFFLSWTRFNEKKKATITLSSEINKNWDTFYFEASGPLLFAYF